MQNLITLTDPRSSAAEAYQSLRTNLEFSSLEQPLHSILITSADGVTDKSVALANLAVVMTQAGDRVTIVDGDLRRPQQHEIFDLPNQAGLSNWLSDGGPAPLQRTSLEGLQVMTSGPLPANPVALLSNRRLADALTELQEQADYLLIDAPPILAVTDAALWASKVDGVVLLVNAGRTKRDHAQRAKTVLEKVRARIVGAVLLDAERDAAMSGYNW
ncbi:MAG: CpsD/CapB family tyrosine-protein kinase [Chloroflexota bacterium]|jgi:capsular exopolysaccharide synthesis family protein|nr:CpsD/CapB family tyrosine-protein kinase [Chloroflexota bacterium]